MKSYVNIASKSNGDTARLNAFRKRIQDERGDELNKNPDLKFRRNWSILFNDWQLLDENDNISKQDERNLYVSDWQVINTAKT